MTAVFLSLVWGFISSPIEPMKVADFLNTPGSGIKDACLNFYTEDAEFSDPFVSLQGRDRIIGYNIELFQNIRELRFEIESQIVSGREEFLTWTLYLRHRNIHSGDWVTTKGITYVRRSASSGKVEIHRDFYDTGPALYEELPILGWFIRKARSQVRNIEAETNLKPLEANSASKPIDFEEYFSGPRGFLLDKTDAFYDFEAQLETPLDLLSGINAIRLFQTQLADRLVEARFEPEVRIKEGLQEGVLWKGSVRHLDLKGGDWVTFSGAVYLKRSPKSGKIIYQRTIYDMGRVLYENLPYIGWIIRWFRKTDDPTSIDPLLK